jgi:FtsZ-interacting cell division protein ZipA
MLTSSVLFNIVIGVLLLAIIPLVPYLKNYFKQKYAFNFSFLPETEEQPESTPQEQKKEDIAVQETPSLSVTTVEKPKPENTNKDATETKESKKPSLEDKPSSSDVKNDIKDPEIEISELNSQKNNPKNIDTPQPEIETEKQSATPPPQPKATQQIENLTFYIVPKDWQGETQELSGEKIMEILSQKNYEGNIEFNSELQCYTHFTKSKQLVYNIYKATPLEGETLFPLDIEERKHIFTAGLMLHIEFPVTNMPAVYAYNNYFRNTAKRIAEELDYRIYDEGLREWTEAKLEKTRKQLITQKQGSFL